MFLLPHKEDGVPCILEAEKVRRNSGKTGHDEPPKRPPDLDKSLKSPLLHLYPENP
jgi:hypothetical protein